MGAMIERVEEKPSEIPYSQNYQIILKINLHWCQLKKRASRQWLRPATCWLKIMKLVVLYLALNMDISGGASKE